MSGPAEPGGPARRTLPTVLGVLAALYASQGLPYGFFTQALPVLLREQGASLPAIGLANLLLLPWVLKFLWAPRVDALAHARGRVLLALQGLTIGVVLLPALFAPGGDGASGLTLLMATMLLASLLAATQDVATDGYAVAALPAGAVGLGNALQVGGYRVGMIVGGGALLVVFAQAGWGWTFGAMAALLAVLTVPVAWAGRALDAPVAETGARCEPQGALRGQDAPVPPLSWGHWLRTPTLRTWLLVLVAAKLGDALGGAMVKPMLVDDGWTKASLGTWLGTLGSAAALVGALAGGWIVGRMGALRAMVVFGVLQALPQLGWALSAPAVPTSDLRVVDVRPDATDARVAVIEVRGVPPGSGMPVPEVRVGGVPAVEVTVEPAGEARVRLRARVEDAPAGVHDVEVRAGDALARARDAWGTGFRVAWMPLLAVLENLLGSVVTVAMFAAMMGACRREHAGTDYTVQACVVTLVQGVTGPLAGLLADALGWGSFFLLAAGISLAGVGVVAWRARAVSNGA